MEENVYYRRNIVLNKHESFVSFNEPVWFHVFSIDCILFLYGSLDNSNQIPQQHFFTFIYE